MQDREVLGSLYLIVNQQAWKICRTTKKPKWNIIQKYKYIEIWLIALIVIKMIKVLIFVHFYNFHLISKNTIIDVWRLSDVWLSISLSY